MLVEEPVPGERGTTGKGCEEVVCAEERTGTDGEHGEGDVLGDVGLTVDEVLAFAETHEVAESYPDEGAEYDTHDDLVCTTCGDEINVIRN